MYSKTTADNIEEILQKNPWQYYDELEELDDLRDDEECLFYESDDMLIMHAVDNAEIWAMPLSKDFDLAAFEKWLARQGDDFTVHMNVTGMNPGSFRYQEFYDVSNPIESYYHPVAADFELKDEYTGGELGAKVPGTIRVLTADDDYAVKNFYQAEIRGVMDLQQVFSFIINDELGKIIAYFDLEGRLLAYLSTMYGFSDALVVDDLYVQPSRRNSGVGQALARACVAIASSEDMAVYWPVAETKEYQEVASAADFEHAASRITIQNL